MTERPEHGAGRKDMARFRGTLKGQRGEASRLGNAKTGLEVECNGWDAGVSIRATVSSQETDIFAVYMTGGSNGGLGELLGTVTRQNGFLVWKPVRAGVTA